MEREERWVRAVCRRGSRMAAEKLVRAHYDEIFRYAYRQCGERQDALDLTQDIFVAALGALPSFDGRKASFRTWLFRIATHKIIDGRRRARPVASPLDEEAVADERDPFAQVRDRMALAAVEEFVAAQPPEVQEVFRLHVYAEKPFSEVAAVLGESEAAVKARYYRLVARLRKEFDFRE